MGLDRSFGSVLVHGEEVSRATVAERIARGLSLVSEDRKEEGLLLGRSIAENTVLARPKSATRGPFLSPSRMAEAAVRFIERLAIRTSGPQAPVGTLSGGNQQKVQFARVLHAGANVLLLDEPTRGIDLGAKAALFDLLAQLRAEGAAVLMVSSALPELLSHCDSIALLRGGILAQPTPASEWTEPLLLEALLSAPASGALAGGEHSVGPPSSGAAGASASHGPSTEADA
jgi:ribose transport system ATP-binding protein